MSTLVGSEGKLLLSSMGGSAVCVGRGTGASTQAAEVIAASEAIGVLGGDDDA